MPAFNLLAAIRLPGYSLRSAAAWVMLAFMPRLQQLQLAEICVVATYPLYELTSLLLSGPLLLTPKRSQDASTEQRGSTAALLPSLLQLQCQEGPGSEVIKGIRGHTALQQLILDLAAVGVEPTPSAPPPPQLSAMWDSALLRTLAALHTLKLSNVQQPHAPGLAADVATCAQLRSLSVSFAPDARAAPEAAQISGLSLPELLQLAAGACGNSLQGLEVATAGAQPYGATDALAVHAAFAARQSGPLRSLSLPMKPEEEQLVPHLLALLLRDLAACTALCQLQLELRPAALPADKRQDAELAAAAQPFLPTDRLLPLARKLQSLVVSYVHGSSSGAAAGGASWAGHSFAELVQLSRAGAACDVLKTLRLPLSRQELSYAQQTHGELLQHAGRELPPGECGPGQQLLALMALRCISLLGFLVDRPAF